MISVTCATAGSLATATAMSPTSDGFSMSLRRSADGGTGRWSRMSVATSPGAILVQRMPGCEDSRGTTIAWRDKRAGPELAACSCCYEAERVGNTSGWEAEAELDLMLMQPTVLKFFEVDGIAQRAHGLISHGGNNNANTPVDQDSKGSHAWFRPRHQADPPSRPEQ
jgi:hypothetical protein